MRKRLWYLAVAALATAVAVAGLASAGSAKNEATLTKVTLQSKWVAQAQFAGFYAAKAKGFYKQVGLDVNIKVGGPDIIPEQVVLGGQAEFGIDWLPSLLSTREQGGDLVNIGQVFARSGTTEVTWKDSGLNTIKKLKGKKYGVWIFGNEFEQQAALVKAGLDPKKDVRLVKQNFDMVAFLKREIDAASAMTYNELAQVLETKNPKTGKLYQLSDLNVFKMSDLGCRHAAGRRLRQGRLDRRQGEPGHGGEVPAGVVQGLGVLPRPLQGVRRHRPRTGNGAAARTSVLADERGQRADLAEQARDRRDGSCRVEDHGRHRVQVQGDQEAGDAGVLPHRTSPSWRSPISRSRVSTSSARSWKKSVVILKEGGK